MPATRTNKETGQTEVKVGRTWKAIDTSKPLPSGRPAFLVAYGLGVDSTAMLGHLWQLSLTDPSARPDVIMFADVGGEKRETYAYLPIIQKWLAQVGFPAIQVVSRTTHGDSSKFVSLEEACRTNKTIPSLAFRYKKCSNRWKIGPQNYAARRMQVCQETWARGLKCTKAIGYDASTKDMKRSKISDDSEYHYVYPMRDAGFNRDDCKRIITEVMGLPVPMKSSCFFCPAMKMEEIKWLAENHPDLAQRALAMEDGFRNGPTYLGADPITKVVTDKKTGEPIHYKRGPKKGQVKTETTVPVQGLGSRGPTWRSILEESNPAVIAQMEANMDSVGCPLYGQDEMTVGDEMEAIGFAV